MRTIASKPPPHKSQEKDDLDLWESPDTVVQLSPLVVKWGNRGQLTLWLTLLTCSAEGVETSGACALPEER